MRRTSRMLALVMVTAGVATACAPTSSGGSSTSTSPKASGTSSSAAADPCTKDQLKTYTAGKLTLATDKPVYAPWFVDDKPENGKGYELSPNNLIYYDDMSIEEH